MAMADNADSNSSEKKMEKEDSVRTVDCLRGRLLAERVASRNAKEEAEHLGYKLIELENLVKQEAKSRNRAEKKLKSLLKKLESRNISYVSEESENSGSVDKSDISSVSSAASSRTKEPQEKCDKITTDQETEENSKTPEGLLENLKQNESKISTLSQNDDSSTRTEEGSLSERPELKGLERELQSNEYQISQTGSENFGQNVAKSTTIEGSLTSGSEENFEKSSRVECDDQNYNDSKINKQSVESFTEGGLYRKIVDQDSEDEIVDNSMALVVVEGVPEKSVERIDPQVLDATVKEVLDALKHAKEQLQSSMERRRLMNMIKV